MSSRGIVQRGRHLLHSLQRIRHTRARRETPRAPTTLFSVRVESRTNASIDLFLSDLLTSSWSPPTVRTHPRARWMQGWSDGRVARWRGGRGMCVLSRVTRGSTTTARWMIARMNLCAIVTSIARSHRRSRGRVVDRSNRSFSRGRPGSKRRVDTVY
jgi:hypothetical protein